MRTKIWTKYELIDLILLITEIPEELQDFSRHFYACMSEYEFIDFIQKRMAGRVIQLGNKRYYII